MIRKVSLRYSLINQNYKRQGSFKVYIPSFFLGLLGYIVPVLYYLGRVRVLFSWFIVKELSKDG